VSGYSELKQHKSWFHIKCSKLLDQRKQAKLHWLQNSSQANEDILNNVKRETSINQPFGTASGWLI
jgi:hypothetical protein